MNTASPGNTTDPSEISNRLQIALKSISAARAYTHTLLEDLTEEDWFWMPDGLATHVAWQIGHLAYAQYGLVLFRQRGRQLEDGELMSNKFRKLFAKSSTPLPQAETLPLEEIRSAFDRIYDNRSKKFRSWTNRVWTNHSIRPTRLFQLVMDRC